MRSGLSSLQLLQTITGNGKRNEEEEEEEAEEEADTSQSKKHLAMLKTDLADKNHWSSSSSDSLSINEDIKKLLPNGSHTELQGTKLTLT